MSHTPPSKTVYFVRHGQDEQGSHEYFQTAESPLTSLGEEQARFVAERCATLKLDLLVSSPMVRAMKTAEVIAGATGLSVVSSALFREYLAPTSLRGQTRATETGRTYVAQMLDHFGDADWHFEDEDNYFDLHARAIEALQFLLDRPEQDILVVTHAGFLRALITAMMTEGEPDARLTRMLMRFLKPMNTGISVCHYHPEESRRNHWRLVSWNDHAHLAEVDLEEPL